MTRKSLRLLFIRRTTKEQKDWVHAYAHAPWGLTMLSSGTRAALQELMQRSIFQRWHGYNGLVLVREHTNDSNSLTHGVALERRRCIIARPRRRVWAPYASVLPVSATPLIASTRWPSFRIHSQVATERESILGIPVRRELRHEEMPTFGSRGIQVP
jgi:hypothetical protein